ncbi:MAG: hypothetical protein ACFWUL_10805 [Dialister sp.]|jgi:hypothetical protein
MEARRTNYIAPQIIIDFAAKPRDLNSLHSILKSIPIMQALGEGPRQSRRMD